MTLRSLAAPRRLLALAAALALAGCDSSDTDPQPETRNVVQVAQATPTLSTLVAAVQAAGLADDLAGAGPFTVFAPNNAAFAAVNPALLNALLGSPAQLADLLTYHVVAGELRAADLRDGQTLTTLQGGTLAVTTSGGRVFVDGVEVVQADVDASNGVVHVLGGVLIEPVDVVDAAGLLGFSSLTGAATRAGLVDALRTTQNITVFAPTNTAFAAVNTGALTDAQLANVLRYHVVPTRALAAQLQNGQTLPTLLTGQTLTARIAGSTVTIDGAQADGQVVTADVVVGNGVIHAVNGVLLPSTF